MCYSLVSETTSVFPSKQYPCKELGEIAIFSREEGLENARFFKCFFSTVFTPEPTCGGFLTGEGKKWQRHVVLILPLRLTLVILFIQITCRPYDVTFMSLLSVFFDRAVDVNLLGLCRTNRASLFNHHHLFQSSMLIRTGPDLFQKLPRFNRLMSVFWGYCLLSFSSLTIISCKLRNVLTICFNFGVLLPKVFY